MTILGIIHRPVFYLKYDVSESGYCRRLQVDSTEVGSYTVGFSPHPDL
jgi:hypothetical protein